MDDKPTGGRTGGVYIPPFKLAQMRKQIEMKDGSSEEEQKLSWEALRKSINGLINKVNASNIKHIIPELFNENLIRGRGLLARAIMKAQLASPGFTHIYAALVAVLNTKLPENGELLLNRVIYSFKRAYKRRDKIVASALAKFIAHLVNHQVAHELLALQLLTVLLEEPSDDSVEIAVNFVKEVGQLLNELSPQGLHAIFERFRALLHEGDIDKRVQYTIEGLFAIRKSNFEDYPAIPKELDLVEKEDQITFETGLDDDVDKQEMLDIYRYDPHFKENEILWNQIKQEILGGDDDEEEDEEEEEGGGGENGENEENEDRNTALISNTETAGITDLTEQELINLRRTLYLTIMSSASFEECTHKIMKLKIPNGLESELCNMLIECCANEKSYQRYYGLIGQRICMIHTKYQISFENVFNIQYLSVHRLETNKLRNVAKFFGHLLSTDALPWTCLECIKLNEQDTTSSSRIFIKILIQELSEAMGLNTLKTRFMDPYMQDIFNGIFPKTNTRDTRFAINFFTSIGLGGLTDDLREFLKLAPILLAKQMEEQMKKEMEEKLLLSSQQQLQQDKGRRHRRRRDRSHSSDSSTSSSSSDSSSSSSSSSSSDSDSSSSSSSSDSDSSSSNSSSSTSSSGSSSSDSSSSSSDSSSSESPSTTNKNNLKNRPRDTAHKKDDDISRDIKKQVDNGSHKREVNSQNDVSERVTSSSNNDPIRRQVDNIRVRNDDKSITYDKKKLGIDHPRHVENIKDEEEEEEERYKGYDRYQHRQYHNDHDSHNDDDDDDKKEEIRERGKVIESREINKEVLKVNDRRTSDRDVSEERRRESRSRVMLDRDRVFKEDGDDTRRRRKRDDSRDRSGSRGRNNSRDRLSQRVRNNSRERKMDRVKDEKGTDRPINSTSTTTSDRRRDEDNSARGGRGGGGGRGRRGAKEEEDRYHMNSRERIGISGGRDRGVNDLPPRKRQRSYSRD